jgi:hypothetical protein
MYEAFAADLLRSTRAETKPFGKLLRDERANTAMPAAKSAKLAVGNQAWQGHAAV